MTVLSIQDMDELIGFGKPASKTADWIVNTYLPNAPVSYRLSIEHAIAAAIIESKHIHHTHAPGEGWQWVPKELTDEMMEAWCEGAEVGKEAAVNKSNSARAKAAIYMEPRTVKDTAPAEWLQSAYDAMLAAAPSPEGKNTQETDHEQ